MHDIRFRFKSDYNAAAAAAQAATADIPSSYIILSCVCLLLPLTASKNIRSEKSTAKSATAHTRVECFVYETFTVLFSTFAFSATEINKFVEEIIVHSLLSEG